MRSKRSTLGGIIWDPIGTHKIIRGIVGFLFGFSLGFIIYVTIIRDLNLDKLITLILGSIIIFMLSFGCALSIQVRCVCVLTIPVFCGRAGRSVLRALVFGYLIAGPIANLTYNGKEVVRTFACSTQLTYNLSKIHFDLMFKPFQQAILGMKKNEHELKETVYSVKELMAPIVEEIEDKTEMNKLREENDYVDELQSDTKRSEEIEKEHQKSIDNAETEAEVYEANYREKVHLKCEDQLSVGAEKCREMFQSTYNKCYDKVSYMAAWLLCWPMKLTFLCNLVQALGGSKICNPDGNIDFGIGKGFTSLKGAKKKLEEGMKDAKIQYKLSKPEMPLDARDASDTAKAIVHEFDERREIFDSIMILIKRILAFIFLKILINAQNYHDKYLTDIQFDNHYLSPYFYKIDERRRERNTLTLLPLKKFEKPKFSKVTSLKPSRRECTNFSGQSVKIIFEMIIASTFLLIDYIFFETLDIVRRHAAIEFTQEGHNDFSIDVKGIGVVAKLVRSVIGSFNVKKHLKTTISNKICLPQANKLSSHVYNMIYGTYLTIWLMLILTSYTQRIQRIICSYFYRKREKRRILYLYNETLRRRVVYLRYLKQKVKRLVKENERECNLNPCLALTIDYPRLCCWLKLFTYSRSKCLICQQVKPINDKLFHTCDTPNCLYVHCFECWNDIGQICLGCTDLTDTNSDENYDSQTSIDN